MNKGGDFLLDSVPSPTIPDDSSRGGGIRVFSRIALIAPSKADGRISPPDPYDVDRPTMSESLIHHASSLRSDLGARL